MKHTRILLLVLLILGVNSCSKEDYRTAIHGRVLNINSTDPVPNVKVYLAGSFDGIYSIVDSTIADENGYYSLAHESPHPFNDIMHKHFHQSMHRGIVLRALFLGVTVFLPQQRAK